MEVPRLEEPLKHLAAPLPAIERAVLHRANALEADPSREHDPATVTGADVRVIVARELRALAAELHHWR